MKPHTREKRLQVLISKLEAGDSVANREIANVLTDDEYHDYKSALEMEKQSRIKAEDKPSELINYNKQVHYADLIDGRAESLSARRKGPAAEKFIAKAEMLYERALESLEEWYSRDQSCQIYFDRNLDFAAGSLLGPDKHGIPRDRSLRTNYAKMSIAEIKAIYLEKALEALIAEEKTKAPVERTWPTDSAELREFLRKKQQ